MSATARAKRDDLAAPSAVGIAAAAHATIVAFLRARRLTHTGGCRLFYTGAEWAARGEQYGTNALLVVAYDGADAKYAFSLDRCYDAGSYEPNEALQEALRTVGCYAEECTHWYSAIYPINAERGGR